MERQTTSSLTLPSTSSAGSVQEPLEKIRPEFLVQLTAIFLKS